MSGEGNNNNSDKLLIEMFTKGFEETKTITQNLQSENRSTALSLAELRTDINATRQQTDWLIKNVRDEGGDRSVMSRLLALEKDFEDIEEWMVEQKKEKDLKSKHTDSIISEDHKGKWQLRIALATGCFGFIATIITAIMSFYLKK